MNLSNRLEFLSVSFLVISFLNGVVSWGAELDTIKKLGVLRVGVDATFAPFEYTVHGKKTGFEVDLVEEVAKELGAAKIEWVDLDFKGLIPGLLARRFDMIASGMYITPERSKVVSFSDSFYPGGIVALVKADNTSIHSIKDLDGQKVAVQTGTKSVWFLKQNYPKMIVLEVEKNAEMFNHVETGRAVALTTGKPVALAYVQKLKTLKVIEPPLTTEEYGFAIRKGSSKFLTEINRALKTVKTKGSYQKLVDKWFGKKPDFFNEP